jgi:hypothetical protein
MKLDPYKIICSRNQKEVEQLVNLAIEHGYQTLGGVSTIVVFQSERGTEVQYTQSMIFPKNETTSLLH